ncbi:restriction endonuclease subunit S [Bacteroides hominis]|uniref:restriction endonuclease subunit S n=1 Tax=Bacteroides hominis TaxID=2763023 RepID=UPI003F525794
MASLQDIAAINPKSDQLQNTFIYIDLEAVEKGELRKIQEIMREEAPSRAQRVINNNDILFQCVRPYQKNNYIHKILNTSNQQWVASTGYAQIRTTESPNYIYHLLNTDGFNRKVMVRCTGSSYPAINSEDLATIRFYYTPDKKEQFKISRLLDLIDERIATQNKIIEDLKLLKSAISLNVLHSDTWEQFKIKDIAQIGRGRVISSIEISQQKNPTYPVYSSQTSNDGIMGYLDDYMFEGEYISWTTDGANAGTVFYRNGKFNCTNVCGLLKLIKGFDTHFVSLVLAEATKKYVSINLANPKLMNNTMGNIQICLPKLEEQKRISIVFRVLQRLWTVHNSLLTEYIKQKQYLLSQMFI